MWNRRLAAHDCTAMTAEEKKEAKKKALLAERSQKKKFAASIELPDMPIPSP